MNSTKLAVVCLLLSIHSMLFLIWLEVSGVDSAVKIPIPDLPSWEEIGMFLLQLLPVVAGAVLAHVVIKVIKLIARHRKT
jgi:hypothetical protein